MKALVHLIDAATPPALALPVAGWVQVWRERQALSRLDARTLADLGLEPEAVRREAARPFWDLPRNRA